jgi:hypothetical protein
MLTFLRFLSLFSLSVWLGGILYFAFVVAPAVFGVLPTRHLAGLVVARSLTMLHTIGIAAGLVFLVSSITHYFLAAGFPNVLAPRHILVAVMLALTAGSQFVVAPRMAVLRAEMGEVDLVAPDDARRVQFNRLHRWSTALETAVLVLGLVVLWLLARDMTLRI